VVNVHFSDLLERSIFPDLPYLYTFFKHHQMPGQGTLPLTEFMRLLLAGGYCGVLTLEVSPTALRAWSRQRISRGLTRAVASVRRLEAEARRL
jgi:sugar phosphate isomerase/epimerase